MPSRLDLDNDIHLSMVLCCFSWLWMVVVIISPLQTFIPYSPFVTMAARHEKAGNKIQGFSVCLMHMGTFAIVTYLFHIPLENKL